MQEINQQIQTLHVADVKAQADTQGVVITLSNIQFVADSAVLTEAEKTKLLSIADILKRIPNRKILIEGHTALAGAASGRQRISLERAQAVADYLVSLGAKRTDQIVVRGFGASRPVATNETPEGMALNRRVEITILED